MPAPISVVIITLNRAAQIRTTLENLLALPEHPRVIVIDNGSTDGTAQVVRRFGRQVEYVALSRNHGAAGRNLGVERSVTPYIAFADDDSWWAPGALSRACTLFDSQAKLGLIAARILVGPEERLDPTCRKMATGPLARSRNRGVHDGGIPVIGFLACGAIVRRSAFLDAGGFDSRLGFGGEEVILALELMRRGWALSYRDEIVAHHHPSPIRDYGLRRRLETRNAIWSTWLRRPARSALVVTRRIAASAIGDRDRRAGLMDALRGMPWVLRARNPISSEVDRMVKAVEDADYRNEL